MKTAPRLGWFAIGLLAGQAAIAQSGLPENQTGTNLAATLSVAAVQLRSSTNLSDNAARITKHLRDCAANGARVVIFPECALTGYADTVTNFSENALAQAEQRIASACREAGVYAIVGTVHRAGEKVYNSAMILGPTGQIIERYHKIQLAERWPQPGDHLSVFKIDGIPCSVIICHDERYPELVRLPVLAGARVTFYLSHESGLRQEHKIEPYRAQIQARAVENSIFIVQANAPANEDLSGSHGHSRIIAPDGHLIQEASIFQEQVVTAKLDLRRADRGNALKSLTRGPLRDWWKEGVRQVRIVE